LEIEEIEDVEIESEGIKSKLEEAVKLEKKREKVEEKKWKEKRGRGEENL